MHPDHDYLIRFITPENPAHVGFVTRGLVYNLSAAFPDRFATLSAVLSFWQGKAAAMLDDLQRMIAPHAPLCGLDEFAPAPDPRCRYLLPPVDRQEVWAAGVTYKRSEDARETESGRSGFYARVYSAPRPELFFKSLASNVVAPGDAVGIRHDAKWSVPEPELAVVVNAAKEVVGFTIGNDMSSRDIEGENPLYLPQAKVYDRACALGPALWLQPGTASWPEVVIQLTIRRGAVEVCKGETSTAQIKRSLPELVEYLVRCRTYKFGVVLLTGTGIVPKDDLTLRAGDMVEIQIEPIDTLRNPVVIV